MYELNFSATELVESLLNLPSDLNLCLLDSCGVSHLDSHLLIAGISPIEVTEITTDDVENSLHILDKKLSLSDLSAIMTFSYNFGLKLNGIKTKHQDLTEPDIFLALFDTLIIHDYNIQKTYLTGNKNRFRKIEQILNNAPKTPSPTTFSSSKIVSNFSRKHYYSAIEKIQEYINCGDTYQTNLTRQIRAELPQNLKSETIFRNLRSSYPAPFASFIRRTNDVVISASPERFFKVENENISVSPIKGTCPRGKTVEEDFELKNELINSEKNRAENIMIVDLLRNDIGKICEFGSVKVEKLCELEEHPTLFHLVSTISGKLRPTTKFSEILLATFPCGSITGAPKFRTMQLIDEIETVSRGLSMGAIGFAGWNNLIDLSVAIRTMTIAGNKAIFNLGGGIVTDSMPENEYEETLTKGKALFNSIRAAM